MLNSKFIKTLIVKSRFLSGKKQITLAAFLLIACYGNLKSQSITLQLSPTNISCFGSRDGSIDMTITGGTPPYTIRWSNEETTEDISNLAASYYGVRVDDSDTLTEGVHAEITLIEPEALRMEISLYEYPNGHNISLFGACNGIATITASGGVNPITYQWTDGSTSQNRSNLCARNYGVTATDANGCEVSSEKIYITQPPESNWARIGNGNTNSSTDFLGTLDAADFSIRTYNQERLRVKASGDITVSSLSGSGNRMIMADANGKLIAYPCFPWSTCGNTLLGNDFFGSTNNMDIVFKTDINSERFRISDNGGIKIKKYESLPDGIFYNSAGLIEKIDFTTPEDVLLGNGTFGPLPGGASYWALSGSNHLYNTNLSGKVGIGINSPSEKLQLTDGSMYIQGEGQGLIVDAQADKRVGFMKYSGKEAGIWRIYNQDFEIGRLAQSVGSSLPGNPANSNDFIIDLLIDGNGKVGIGTTPPSSSNYFLFVAGGIATRDVKVTAYANWPDYIFNTDYQPISIYELEQFINQNKHLPEMPSTKQVEKNNGFEVGEMQIKLLKKIEEQTLYIIDLQKQVDELKAQMNKKQ